MVCLLPACSMSLSSAVVDVRIPWCDVDSWWSGVSWSLWHINWTHPPQFYRTSYWLRMNCMCLASMAPRQWRQKPVSHGSGALTVPLSRNLVSQSSELVVHFLSPWERIRFFYSKWGHVHGIIIIRREIVGFIISLLQKIGVHNARL